jgi:hypothetical protein
MYLRIGDLLCAGCLLCTCLHREAAAFSPHGHSQCEHHVSSTRTYNPFQSASSELEAFTSENGDLLTDQPPPETELWLDLRSTAMHPKAAMDHLESQLPGSSNHFVDRILLSEQVFQNLVDYSDLYLRASRILYQNSEKDSILSATGDGLSVPFGSVLPLPSDPALVVDDPMQAIQIISGGRWLVLGNEDENVDYEQESRRLDAVGNFLEIASTASGAGGWGASAETKGLVLPTRPAQTKGMPSVQGVGGVAMKCYTKSALMKFASAIRLMKPGIMTSITNSGIVLQSTDHGSPSISTAIILPFDVGMWEASVLVFGKEDVPTSDRYE